MSKLRLPLVDHLEDPASEAELHRVWQGIRRRRTGHRPPTSMPLWAWGAITLVGVVVTFFWLNPHPREPGPLLVDGSAVESLGGNQPTLAALSDGSRIGLASSSTLEVLHNDGRSFVSVLRKGRGTFDVRPGGPRRWRVEVAGVAVEVVGTRFDVVRSDEEVTIHVDHGVVLVRGDSVPDKVQRLLSGEKLVVPLGPQVTRTEAEPSTPSPTSPEPAAGKSEELAKDRSASPGLLADSADRATGNQSAAQVSKEDAPLRAGVPSAVAPGGTALDSKLGSADLSFALRSADAQRASGNPSAAIQTLREALAKNPGDARRALAAFTLAKLLLDGGEADEAQRALRVCLDSNPGRALEEDAWARLVEAQARGGKLNAARRTAAVYSSRYPAGRRLEEVKRWAQGD